MKGSPKETRALLVTWSCRPVHLSHPSLVATPSYIAGLHVPLTLHLSLHLHTSRGCTSLSPFTSLYTFIHRGAARPSHPSLVATPSYIAGLQASLTLHLSLHLHTSRGCTPLSPFTCRYTFIHRGAARLSHPSLVATPSYIAGLQASPTLHLSLHLHTSRGCTPLSPFTCRYTFIHRGAARLSHPSLVATPSYIAGLQASPPLPPFTCRYTFIHRGAAGQSYPSLVATPSYIAGLQASPTLHLSLHLHTSLLLRAATAPRPPDGCPPSPSLIESGRGNTANLPCSYIAADGACL